MKCAFFCCLLAYCAFELVLANDYDAAWKTIDDYSAKKQNEMSDFVREKKAQTKYDKNCKNKFRDGIGKNDDDQKAAIKSCKDEACYQTHIDAAKKEANRVFGVAKSCILN